MLFLFFLSLVNMKIAIVFGFVMFATSIVSSNSIYDEIEDEWNLFKVCRKKEKRIYC